jgi:hypothetical protein
MHEKSYHFFEWGMQGQQLEPCESCTARNTPKGRVAESSDSIETQWSSADELRVLDATVQ